MWWKNARHPWAHLSPTRNGEPVPTPIALVSALWPPP
jgi:hypothetical protein